VFFFHPPQGTFAANSVTEFKLEFKPFKVDTYRRKVELCLDLSDHVMNKDAPPECDYVVMETQLEAMGHSADLRLEPPFVHFTGTVLTKREYREELILINDTAVESHFSFERLDTAADAFEVVPATGVVPARSCVVCQVSPGVDTPHPIPRHRRASKCVCVLRERPSLVVPRGLQES